eukprot:COSAG06_NODE_1228_length_10179_cov_3.735119_1_plen_46_part_10
MASCGIRKNNSVLKLKMHMKYIRSVVRFPLSSHAESSSACRAADTA